MLFDSVPIENYIFSLIHAKIGIENKIINLFYDSITKHVEKSSDKEAEIFNVLIDLQIELNQNKESFGKLIKNYYTTIADLKIEKKIESLFKEKDDNNCLLIIGNYKFERLNEIKEIKSQINELFDKRKENNQLFSAINNV